MPSRGRVNLDQSSSNNPPETEEGLGYLDIVISPPRPLKGQLVPLVVVLAKIRQTKMGTAIKDLIDERKSMNVMRTIASVNTVVYCSHSEKFGLLW
jgi:hypothetical protein